MSSTTLDVVAVTLDRSRRFRLVAYALLLPSGLVLLAFTYWPVLQVVLGSLTIRTFGGVAH